MPAGTALAAQCTAWQTIPPVRRPHFRWPCYRRRPCMLRPMQQRQVESVVRLPNVPVLVAGLRDVAWLSPSGEFTRVSRTEAAAWVVSRPPILCHAPATARRLGVERFPAFDLLELFAFVRPAQLLPADAARTGAGARPAAAGRPRRRGGHAARRRPRPALRAGRAAGRAHPRDRLGDGARRLALGSGGAGGARCRRPRPAAPHGRQPVGVGRPAGMVGARAAAAARQCAGGAAWRRGGGSRPARARRRDAAAAGRLCLGGERGVRAARPRGRAALRAGRGRHRRRQDARLYRAGRACGPRRTAARSGSPPTRATCSTRSTANSTGSTRTRRSRRRQVVVRKGRENYPVPAESTKMRRAARR